MAGPKGWCVKWADACCTYRRHYRTRREARLDARRLRGPVRDYWGRATGLRRKVSGPFRVR